MSMPKIEERSLYAPIVEYLKAKGFKAIGELKVDRKEPDILLKTHYRLLLR